MSNERVQRVASQVFGSMLYAFCPHGFEEVSIGVSGKFDDAFRAEDLCSIPDLVGGAFAEALTSLGEGLPHVSKLYAPFLTRLSTKTDLILRWASLLDGPLKFLPIVVRPAGDNLNVTFPCQDRHPDRSPDFRVWMPLDKGWRESLRSWHREFLFRMSRRGGG